MANGKKIKTFDNINTGHIYENLSKSTSTYRQQGEAGPEEKAKRAAEMRTQGRKGCRAVRINMAFSSDNYDFLHVMAKISGKTVTGFCNYALDKYREEHGDVYKQAKELFEKL